jgi:hypothetical protein
VENITKIIRLRRILLKLSDEEQFAFDKIKAISRKDVKTLRDVFISMIKLIALETYFNKENSFVFYIPYLCGVKVDYYDKLRHTPEGILKGKGIEMKMTIIPSETFINEIEAISAGEVSPSEKYIKKQIIEKVSKLLDVSNIEIEEEVEG